MISSTHGPSPPRAALPFEGNRRAAMEGNRPADTNNRRIAGRDLAQARRQPGMF
jgi:hypothetical protein